jgi:hypothetical protein
MIFYVFFLLSRMSTDLTPEEEEALLRQDDDDAMDGDGKGKAPGVLPPPPLPPPPPPPPPLSAAAKSTTPRSSVSDESSSGIGQCNLPKIYRNIRAAKLSTMAVRTLGGSAASNFTGIGSFSNDSRFANNNNRFCYSSKLNLSCSFDTGKVVCNTCTNKGLHTVLYHGGEKFDKINQSPRCFVLTDQNFAPAVPVAGEGECLKIVIVEDGTLDDLATAFLDITKGFSIPAGSVVVLCSVSHLAWAGTAAYAGGWVAVRNRIMRMLGGGVEVVHGFPLLQIGTADASLIRSLIDLECWLDSLGLNSNRDICKTRKHVCGLLFPLTEPVVTCYPEAGTPLAPVSGPPLAPGSDPFTMRLPVNLTTGEMGYFKSPGFKDMPRQLVPLTPEDEVNSILTMIRELNEKFVLDLDDDIVMLERGAISEDEAEEKAKSFLLIGCSHANRLSLALEDLGHEVKVINAAGWASNPDVADAVARMIKEEIELDENVFLVFFLYDNEIYKVENQGELTDAVKTTGSSVYHINGRLKTLDREAFKTVFNLSVPLLRSGGENPKLIISPLVRYIKGPCCGNVNHLTNFGEPGYVVMLGEAMADVRAWIKDFTYGKKLRNFKVLCSNTAVGCDGDGDGLRAVWGKDPVHMNASGYEKLAVSLVDTSDTDLTRAPKRSSDSGAGAPAKMSRLDPALQRPSWVTADDVTANRQQWPRPGGRGRGGRGGRGGGWRGRGRGGRRPFSKY